MVVSSSTSLVNSDVPAPLDSSFMTQTDAQGKSLTRAAAPVSAGGSSSSSPTIYGSHDTSLTSPITTKKQPRSRILRWFCCFVGASPSDFDGEIDEDAYTPTNGGGSAENNTKLKIQLQPMNRVPRSPHQQVSTL